MDPKQQGKKTLRMKFRMKLALTGKTAARVWRATWIVGVLAAGTAQGWAQTEGESSTSQTSQTAAQTVPAPVPVKLGPNAPVTYANKWELYAGVNLMNFQAGQALPKRMNMGGGEISGTYWLTQRYGVVAEYRGEAGTTPVLANPYVTRPLVYMNMGLFGVQVRGPKNHYGALNLHAYGGGSYGVFNSGTGFLQPQYNNVGLYGNHLAPMGALGGSVEFNRSKKLAIKLSPDLILEHFGTETREFFAISGGVVYRFGSR